LFRTFFSVFPQGFLFLKEDLLLYLGLLVELVEVVDDDGDGQGDAQHAADGTRCNRQTIETTEDTQTTKLVTKKDNCALT
jgi:hypothetical protein